MTQEERDQKRRTLHLYDQVQDGQTRERQGRLRRRTIWMRVLLPVLAVIIVGLGSLAFTIWRGIIMNRYRSDVELHLLTVSSEWPLQAEYQGRKTLVSNDNLNRIHWALTLSQINLRLLEPQTNGAEEIHLALPTGAVYTIAPETADPNTAVIRYRFGSERRTVSIRGFAVLDWLRRAISEEGITRRNRVVDEFPVVYGEEEEALPVAGETGSGSVAAENRSA